MFTLCVFLCVFVYLGLINYLNYFNQIVFDKLSCWCKLIMISKGWGRFNQFA
ncbi:hypothetical protein D1BOALGB6SA_8120 [Olavius sp. associated proteobacterium Delta 1]|nr:hypothetical protein D1BOALGB6SA_8120 [Olavius sp. associated proteobacterium Delta 1]